MGGSQSTANINQTFNNKMYNRDTLNIANTAINEQIIKTTVDSVKKCTNTTLTEQQITISGINTDGNFIFDSTQAAEIVVDFSCIQKDTVKNEIANKIINDITGNIKSNMDTDLINDMTAHAESESKSDSFSFPWGGSSSNSNVNQIVQNNIVNVQEKDIKNIVKAVTDINFSQSFFNGCVNKVIAKQDVKLSDIKAGGNVTINIDQKLLIKTFTDCVQDAQVGTRIMEDFAYMTGFDVEGGFKSTAKSATDAESKSAAETTGLAELVKSFGDLLGGILGGIFAPFSAITYGPAIAISSSVCCCCFIFIIIILLFFGTWNEKPSYGSLETTAFHEI